MTAVTETPASVNGQAPTEPGEEKTPVSERVLGLFGLAFAAVVGLIAIDLLSGGALSRLANRGKDTGDDDDHG